MSPALLLTGPPGCGKTTLVRRALQAAGVRAGGFYTEEVREAGRRVGFRIVTLEGGVAPLARRGAPGPRVGPSGVNLEGMEAVALPALRRAAREGWVVVVDEIGKMDLLCPAFFPTVWRLLEEGHPVLGTVLATPHPLADRVKSRPDVRLLRLRRSAWEEVLREVVGWLRSALPPGPHQVGASP